MSSGASSGFTKQMARNIFYGGSLLVCHRGCQIWITLVIANDWHMIKFVTHRLEFWRDDVGNFDRRTGKGNQGFHDIQVMEGPRHGVLTPNTWTSNRFLGY